MLSHQVSAGFNLSIFYGVFPLTLPRQPFPVTLMKQLAAQQGRLKLKPGTYFETRYSDLAFYI